MSNIVLFFLNSDLFIFNRFVVRYIHFSLSAFKTFEITLFRTSKLFYRKQQPKCFLCRHYDSQFSRLFSAVDTNQNSFSGPYRAPYHPCVLTSLCGSLFLSVFIPSNSPNHSVTLPSVLLINFNAWPTFT